MNRAFRSMALLLFTAAVSSACDKTAVQQIAEPLAPGNARIKFFNFAVGAPAVHFYANDMKVTATTSATGTESTAGVGYGSVGSGGFYSAVPAGQYTIRGRITATVDKDLPISDLSVTLADGKAYSFYQSGIYNTATKTADSFIVEDPFIPNFDWSVAYVRFVHAMSTVPPMTLSAMNQLDSTVVALGGEVAYKGAGAFTAIPPGVYNLTSRSSGASTVSITRTGVSFVAGRVYTISARGNISVATTVLLDNTANR